LQQSATILSNKVSNMVHTAVFFKKRKPHISRMEKEAAVKCNSTRLLLHLERFRSSTPGGASRRRLNRRKISSLNRLQTGICCFSNNISTVCQGLLSSVYRLYRPTVYHICAVNDIGLRTTYRKFVIIQKHKFHSLHFYP